MTQEENDLLSQFLAGYWYDREEDDTTIVREFVEDATPDERASVVKAAQHALQVPVGNPEYAELGRLIRRSAWVWFPEDPKAPFEWLSRILSLLESSSPGTKDPRHDYSVTAGSDPSQSGETVIS
ncbi:MAG TPA: hypothetical protein VFL82_04515 [Thermomicrobiales bacterium]|nr:hypothetical protein [Thermomicrobiales bacterium]